jgi:hypothetical protein
MELEHLNLCKKLSSQWYQEPQWQRLNMSRYIADIYRKL